MTYDVSDSDPRVISLSLISDPVGPVVPGDQLVINFNSGHIHPTSLPSDLLTSLCAPLGLVANHIQFVSLLVDGVQMMDN